MKRPAEDDNDNDTEATATGTGTGSGDGETASKQPRRPTRKAILLLMYSGTGYHGMQRNVGFETIEGKLLDCLLDGGHISREEFNAPGRLQFQRASKTDKGVSALAQVVSMKLDLTDIPALKSDLSKRLPREIRLLDMFRTIKNFNCKARVNHREYAYICPSYAFAPKSRPIDISYRLDSDQLASVRACLAKYKGTKNYYNFTSGRKPGDTSCNRYIIDFTVGDPFLYQEGEYVELLVCGQSFMLHQIRKMVGLAIAVVKGYCDAKVLEAAFTYRRLDVPKAPGLGLLLSRIDYTAYNGKYAGQLGYQTVDWGRYENQRSSFKSKHIMPEIHRGESGDSGSMLEWLKTLTMHTYDFERIEGPPTTVVTPAAAAASDKVKNEEPPQSIDAGHAGVTEEAALASDESS